MLNPHPAEPADSARTRADRRGGRLGPFRIWIVLLTVSIAAAALLMRQQDARGLPTLAVLEPLVSASVRLGGAAIAHVWSLVALASGTVVLISVIAFVSAGRRLSRAETAVLAVVSLAVVCEAALLDGRIVIGISLVAAAFVTALWQADDSPPLRGAFERRDLVLLGSLTAAAAVLRFYELNRITDVFEGELSPYYLAATHLSGIPLGNAGVNGPWAPLGYLFYVPIYASIKIFGPTVLAVRFSSAAVGLATLTLLYVFALQAYGRGAAVLAGLFYVLDPLQIGWGRTDVHPHGVTTWPALLMCLVCLRAFRSGGLRWFVLLAPLMALTWHQYPSGQTAAFIPVLVLAISLARRERIEKLGAKVALLAAGLAGWLAGPLLTRVSGARAGGLADYFGQLGPRVAWPGDSGSGAGTAVGRLIVHAAVFTGDIVAGLFVKLRYAFHQDVFVPVPDLPSRSISWIVAALVLAGVCLTAARRLRPTADRILASWIVAAIVPAILSDHPYPKRSAMLFPALFVLAAAAGARFVTVLEKRDGRVRRAVKPLAAAAVALWFCGTTWLWFSGVRWHADVPNEVLLANRLRPELTPGTLVIAKLWHGYAPGKLTYLLSDVLRDRAHAPLLWYVVEPERSLQSLVENPTLAAAYASPNAFYNLWPGIVPPTAAAWSHVIFVLQTGITNPDQLRVRGVGPQDRSDQEWFAVLQPVCGPPRVTIMPRQDCDDCGFVVFACPVRR